jgi:hypothetical protein
VIESQSAPALICLNCSEEVARADKLRKKCLEADEFFKRTFVKDFLNNPKVKIEFDDPNETLPDEEDNFERVEVKREIINDDYDQDSNIDDDRTYESLHHTFIDPLVDIYTSGINFHYKPETSKPKAPVVHKKPEK